MSADVPLAILRSTWQMTGLDGRPNCGYQAPGETIVGETTMDKARFQKMFKGRAVMVAQLPPGYARELAQRVHSASGRRDVSLRTMAEHSAFFDLVLQGAHSATSEGQLALLDDGGLPTVAGQAIEGYFRASQGKSEFFDVDMYMFQVTGLRLPQRVLIDPLCSAGNNRLEMWRTDPSDHRQIPPPGEEGVLFSASDFSLVNCGNRTRRAAKRSWRVDLRTPTDGCYLNGMARIRLTAMYNDPSQMREALAWRLFSRSGVPSPRHTYAKLAFDANYRGLFSLIEQVDKRFLKDHFGKNHGGNLYKARGSGDIGGATLEYRIGSDGDDTGRQYFSHAAELHTYGLRTNKNNPEANTYDDLACLIRAINASGLPRGVKRFDTDAYRESMDRIMNTRAFLRWAGINILLGGWDNYFASPSNYYLYNSGRAGAEKDFVASPYFTFIPWDYDNCLGVDYFGISWQYADILDWPRNTIPYWKNRRPSRIPLVQNLLSNHDYLQYYVDHIEYLLDTRFSPRIITAEIGREFEGGLWDRVRQASYLESTTSDGRPFTGRKFTNHEVYWNGYRQRELRHGKAKIEGIVHYVRMRRDSARAQLKQLRRTMPCTTGSGEFPATIEPLPR
jgi:CotH kinase protein